MTDVTRAVIVALLDCDAIGALVSSRIHRKNLPSNPAWPCLCVNEITDTRPGTSAGHYGHAREQVTAFAEDDGTANKLSRLVADCLDGTVSTVIDRVAIVSIQDAGGIPGDYPEMKIYVYHRDFMIEYWY